MCGSLGCERKFLLSMQNWHAAKITIYCAYNIFEWTVQPMATIRHFHGGSTKTLLDYILFVLNTFSRTHIPAHFRIAHHPCAFASSGYRLPVNAMRRQPISLLVFNKKRRHNNASRCTILHLPCACSYTCIIYICIPCSVRAFLLRCSRLFGAVLTYTHMDDNLTVNLKCRSGKMCALRRALQNQCVRKKKCMAKRRRKKNKRRVLERARNPHRTHRGWKCKLLAVIASCAYISRHINNHMYIYI